MSTELPDHITLFSNRLDSVETDWEVMREVRIDIDSYPRVNEIRVLCATIKVTAGIGSMRVVNASAVPPVVLGSQDFSNSVWQDKVIVLSDLPSTGVVIFEFHMKTDNAANPAKAKAGELVVT